MLKEAGFSKTKVGASVFPLLNSYIVIEVTPNITQYYKQ